ncbi:MAG: FCD domain-containing protein, partial [Lachnoanaerobaculum sp.]|nr:FCD domain-containing protein [Lachnoanaerobaculum sp.]
ALESMVLKDYIAIATDSDLEKLEKTVIRLTKSYENAKSFKPDKFKAIDLSMHELWYKKTGHTYLWEQIRKSDSNYTRFCMLDMLECENYEHVILEHRQMYEVIKKRDTSKIEEIVKKHLYGGIERINAAFSKKFDEMFIAY